MLPTGSVKPMSPDENPPKASGKPIRKKATNPMPKMAKFVDTTWAACLARQKPVSTRAKPACMKITRTAPMTTHSRLSCVPRTSTSLGPAWALAMSAAIRPHAVAPTVAAAPMMSFL